MDQRKLKVPANVKLVDSLSMERFLVRVYAGPLINDQKFVLIEAERATMASHVRNVAVSKLGYTSPEEYELSEIFCSGGQLCKERKLQDHEHPVQAQLLWPRVINAELDQAKGLVTGYRFYVRRKDSDILSRTPSWADRRQEHSDVANFLTSFLSQPSSNKEYLDLCNLPDLNEQTLMENIKARFVNGNIYTYVGTILIAVNPFKFFPIYNPTYVKMYQNKGLGELPPHIFSIADAAFHKMLRTKQNQCIVISGESGSGKTESTNLLLHHLTALSQKGMHASGVERTILGAGPVLEALGNAKTVHNNNSSRFGKFIQVNYKENGMVHGAVVEKYLLEKSRIVAQAKDERNYHVFYYLLAGAEKHEVTELSLKSPDNYYYLKQSECYTLEGVDEVYEYSRLKESMELVGFSAEIQRRIFSVLSAVLHLGNVEFRKKGDQSYDDSVIVKNEATIAIISSLLKVKENTLTEALTQKQTIAGEETLVMNYKMAEAIATRDAMAKCLYGSLFDWIVLKVNHALLAKRHHSEHQSQSDTEHFNPSYVKYLTSKIGNSIGVLDIFGFEDFTKNSFEQFCINYANEHLQYYFNQHIFKFEQEEYTKEGIEWKNIEFIDNTGCLELFSKRPNGLFFLLDEECNFPAGTNETLLDKFHRQHRSNIYYSAPQLREQAFCIEHYAGKVKYTVNDFREKNNDLVKTDLVGVLKNSSLLFVRELMGVDPVAVFRWAILRAFFKCFFGFRDAGRRYQQRGGAATPKTPRKSVHKLTSSPAGSGTLDGSTDQNSINDPDVVLSDYINEEAQDLTILSQQPYLSKAESRVIRKASKVLRKNKPLKLKSRQHRSFHDIKALKSIASRSMFGSGKMTYKKQPPSVSTQFQWSLTRLLETLNQANPFFIRCIKSNVDKAPCKFDDNIVLRQLRYTGMLATVKIRQSGYNYRLTFDEFTQMYKILLPKGIVSSRGDVQLFLKSRNLHKDNYQVGITKTFLREADKLLLDEALHDAIMQHVVRIQRWMKTLLERQHFLAVRKTVNLVQRYGRGLLARRLVCRLKGRHSAAVEIQRWIRGYIQRKNYILILEAVVYIQSMVRAYTARRRYRLLLKQRTMEETKNKEVTELLSSTSDKGSSAEELDVEKDDLAWRRRDSEESSGILEDSECDNLSGKTKRRSVSPRAESPLASSPYNRQDSDTTGTLSPEPSPPIPSSRPVPPAKPHRLLSDKCLSPDVTPVQPPISPKFEDEYLVKARSRSTSKVLELSKTFEGKSPTKSSPEITPVKGRKGAKANAPLAKQESISDLGAEQEPPGNKKLAISLSAISAALIKNQERHNQSEISPEKTLSPQRGRFQFKHKLAKMVGELKESTGCSPTYHILRHTRSTIHLLREKSGHRKIKKETQSSVDDSDEDVPLKRPQDFGVKVLPASPSMALKSKENTIAPDNKHTEQQGNKKKKAVRKRERKAAEDLKAQMSRETKRPPGNWAITGTSEWLYPIHLVISGVQELEQLDEFLAKKVKDQYKDSRKRDTIFEGIFKKALKDFHTDMKSNTSIAMMDQAVSMKYRDLMKTFEHILVSRAKRESTNATFPVTMGINAFRGFLDEFMKEVKKEKRDDKKMDTRVVKKDKHKKDFTEYMNHKFQHITFNIPTFCEYCSILMWIMEKGLVCQYCKYACHRKCYNKSSHQCKGLQADQQTSMSKLVFGAALSRLVKEEGKVPPIIENLITTIELQGLYTVGLYRKSGAAQKIKLLKQTMNEDCDSIEFDDYNIHVLTTTLKYFFREMSDPLLTSELYEDFIKAAAVGDEKDKIQGLFAVIDKLPKNNHNLLERLIFHLARVAQHEDSNKMSPNGLAIIFAPCLMWPSKMLQAQESLDLVPKQTMCIECIIKEQLRKLKTTLADISTLESAQATAVDRLSVVRAVVRASMRSPKVKELQAERERVASVAEEDELDRVDFTAAEEEEKALSEQINSLAREKNTLTSKLPTLEYRHMSTDDDFMSVDDAESTLDSMDDTDDVYEEYAVTFDLPVAPPQLRHLNKHRVPVPDRKPPGRYKEVIRLAREEMRASRSKSQYNSMMLLESRIIVAPSELKKIREEDAEILV